MSELDSTSTSATYGPPYNHGTGSVQSLGPVSIQKLFGARISVIPATSFVITPCALPHTFARRRARPLHFGEHATRTAWEDAYNKPLAKFPCPDRPALSSPAMGPVPTFMSSLLAMTRSAPSTPPWPATGFYSSDYTNSLLGLGLGVTASAEADFEPALRSGDGCGRQATGRRRQRCRHNLGLPGSVTAHEIISTHRSPSVSRT